MNRAVKSLLRRKIAMKANSDRLTEAFATVQANIARGQVSKFLGALQTAIMVNIDRTGGINAVKGRLRDMEYSLDLSLIDDLYERSALDFIKFIEASKKVVKKAEYTFVFDEIDNATLGMIRDSFFWMKQDHTEALVTELKDIIDAAFKGEIPRIDLPAYLESKFGEIIKAESRYFKDVSDHIISQGQNLTRINQGQKYDVKYYTVMARIDDKTTDFCKSIHGRIIASGHLEQQRDKILAAKNSKQKIEAAAWVKKDGPFEGNELPGNIGCPPYHFRCRTILQSYWPEESELADVINASKFLEVIDEQIQLGAKDIREQILKIGAKYANQIAGMEKELAKVKASRASLEKNLDELADMLEETTDKKEKSAILKQMKRTDKAARAKRDQVIKQRDRIEKYNRKNRKKALKILSSEKKVEFDLTLDGLSKHQKDAAREGFKWLEDVLDWQPGKKVQIGITKSGRANNLLGEIRVSTYTQPRTVIHEYGHTMEFEDDLILKKSLEFYKKRTKGEKLVHMGKGFEAHEFTRKDDFFDSYCGLDYGGDATELLSMGIEFLYKDPIAFAKADPEHFDFIIQILKGL